METSVCTHTHTQLGVSNGVFMWRSRRNTSAANHTHTKTTHTDLSVSNAVVMWRSWQHTRLLEHNTLIRTHTYTKALILLRSDRLITCGSLLLLLLPHNVCVYVYTLNIYVWFRSVNNIVCMSVWDTEWTINHNRKGKEENEILKKGQWNIEKYYTEMNINQHWKHDDVHKLPNRVTSLVWMFGEM